MYTTEQEKLINRLIRNARNQLRRDKDDLRQSKQLTPHENMRIESELEELRLLELSNRGNLL